MERYYRVFCVSYLPIQEIIEKAKTIAQHYAISPYHDKDKKENGEPKEPHYHVILTFAGNKSLNGIRSHFEKDTNQNFLVKPVGDMQTCFNYLTHEDDEDKYQYDKSEIIIDDAAYWKKYSDNYQTQGNLEFIEDLMSENYNPYDMAIKYGRDYIRNYKSYNEFRGILLK